MAGSENPIVDPQDGSSVKYVFSLMPEKNNKAVPMTFEFGFTEQIPKILEDNSVHFWAF